MKSYLYLVLFILIVFSSCNTEKEIDQETMVKVYVDMLIAKDTLYQDQNLLIVEKNNILDKYNVNDADFSYTLKKYGEDKEIWNEFFKIAFEYLDTLKNRNKIK